MRGARHEELLNAPAPRSKQVAPAKMSGDDGGEGKEPPGGRSPRLLHPSVERHSACAFPSERRVGDLDRGHAFNLSFYSVLVVL